MIYLSQCIFYGIPLAAVIFATVSIYRYCFARKKNKELPGSFSAEEMKMRKILMIISCVIAGGLLLVVLGFMILLFMAVAFM